MKRSSTPSWLSEASLKVGVAEKAGSKHAMEDSHFWWTAATHRRDMPSDVLAIAAVFDGHGGSRCSRFLRRNVADAVSRAFQSRQTRDLASNEQALRHAFTSLEQDFLEEAAEMIWEDGSVAVVAIVTEQPNRSTGEVLTLGLTVAHVGDCRAVLFEQISPTTGQWSHTPLTVDHRVTEPAEARRLEACGAHVEGYYVYQSQTADMGLMCARVFGDLSFKRAQCGIMAQPTVHSQVLALQPGSRVCCLLSSDALGDSLSDEATMAVVQDSLGASIASAPPNASANKRPCTVSADEALSTENVLCQQLVHAATTNGNTDDITTMLVTLAHGST